MSVTGYGGYYYGGGPYGAFAYEDGYASSNWSSSSTCKASAHRFGHATTPSWHWSATASGPGSFTGRASATWTHGSLAKATIKVVAHANIGAWSWISAVSGVRIAVAAIVPPSWVEFSILAANVRYDGVGVASAWVWTTEAAGRLMWEPLPNPANNWTAVANPSDIWTPVNDPSSDWTPVIR